MRGKDIFSIQSLWSSKLVFALLIAGIIIVLIQWVRLIPKSSTTYDEIQDARKELTELESQQKKLQELHTFFQSDFFAEEEARTKLGMQKKDEHVVILDTQRTSSDKMVRANEKDSSSLSIMNQSSDGEQKNTASWWRYFFGDE